MADGVYLTGAGSNIDPTLYGHENLTPRRSGSRPRPVRPAADQGRHRPWPAGLRHLPRHAGNQRGLGGDIHQKVYAEPGFKRPSRKPEDPVAVQYAEAHKVRIEPSSWLARVLGRDEIGVNSLHGQGIKTLGKGLEPLARAEDGLIEAFHAPSRSPFPFAVQMAPGGRPRRTRIR